MECSPGSNYLRTDNNLEDNLYLECGEKLYSNTIYGALLCFLYLMKSVIKKSPLLGQNVPFSNSRSMNNKGDFMYSLIIDNCLDSLALTETWCNENSTASLGQKPPPGYSVIDTRGGGVALIFRDTYKAKCVQTDVVYEFRKSSVYLSLGTNYLHLTAIYIMSVLCSSAFN